MFWPRCQVLFRKIQAVVGCGEGFLQIEVVHGEIVRRTGLNFLQLIQKFFLPIGDERRRGGHIALAHERVI